MALCTDLERRHEGNCLGAGFVRILPVYLIRNGLRVNRGKQPYPCE